MARQQQIPGTDDGFIQEIEDAAEEVGDLCERRMNVHTQEREARKKLGGLLRERKLKKYNMQ